jgi:hypothetical protein
MKCQKRSASNDQNLFKKKFQRLWGIDDRSGIVEIGQSQVKFDSFLFFIFVISTHKVANVEKSAAVWNLTKSSDVEGIQTWRLVNDHIRGAENLNQKLILSILTRKDFQVDNRCEDSVD